MKSKLLTCSIALALSAVLISTAAAVPKYYEIGNGSSVTAFSGPEPPFALVVHTMLDPGLTGTNFILNDGQQFTFNFFDIWTDETTVNADDTVPQNITATLDFLIPNVDPSINGSTVGVAALFGIIQYGQVTWNGPALINLPGDRSFEVTLSDETFNKGLFGLKEGETHGATIEATVKQLTSALAVPENANTAFCLAGAMTGLVALRRFRRA